MRGISVLSLSVVGLAVASLAAAPGGAFAAVATAPTTASCSVSAAGAIGGSFISPYSVYGASAARLDTMFANMKTSGMNTAILQWTGYRYGDGSVATTYQASPGTGFGQWDDSLPRVVAAAKKAGVALWVGLLVSPEVLDDASTNTDAATLNDIADASIRLAADLRSRFGSDIAGWYIPVEPGLQSVNDAARTSLHVGFYKRITDGLRGLPQRVPVLGSPAVARAIEANLTGVQFVQMFEPFFAGSGVDTWALQDGFKMTGWSPADNAALVSTGTSLAAVYGVTVWADVYTPGPGEANFPTSPSALAADLTALKKTGVPIVSFTFDTAMNADPALADASDRRALADGYAAYCRPIAQ
ncbi:DUF4434 domain-containing protein [Leifsonia sp. McL0607]|uniref:DUF4434 domain-containing protein n=1 Tax=Leifsonia sp. McL0607 TaxID=3415672 RepID=UPI003CF71773